jgi:cytochrome d ubiquinol oxidase subunit I
MLRGWQLLAPSGFVALLAGWYVVTEIGRQPWVVYGLLRTADAVSPNLQASASSRRWPATPRCTPSCSAPASGTCGCCARKVRRWRDAARDGTPDSGAKTPARPLSLPDEADIAEGARP